MSRSEFLLGMYIVEVNEGKEAKNKEELTCGEDSDSNYNGGVVVVSDAKRVLIGAGARALFYPTLFYNLVRNKIQSEFRWWDRVDQFILLGAVPFPADVPCLKELGVSGVVSLNEPYETLVPTSLYHAYDIHHLVIPTRDYLFAPSYADIRQAVDFIHENTFLGKTTYVHCKAGRGRSTTIVLCYLIEHRQMAPDTAYEYVRSIRPRVHLASSQWQAVQDYYLVQVKKGGNPNRAMLRKCIASPEEEETPVFDDGSMVFVTESDLDGYHDATSCETKEVNLVCRVQFASQAAYTGISRLWRAGCNGDQNKCRRKLFEIRVY